MAGKTPSQNDNSSSVLVINFFTELHGAYWAAISGKRFVQFATNCTDGMRILTQDVRRSIKTVVIQGLSLQNAGDQWEDFANTLRFVEEVHCTGFNGVVFVVSQSLGRIDTGLLIRSGKEHGTYVEVASKQDFLAITFGLRSPNIEVTPQEQDIWDMWFEKDFFRNSNFDFLRAQCEWPEAALTRLQAFKTSMSHGDMTEMLHHLVQLGIAPVDDCCDCPWDVLGEHPRPIPALIHHRNHGVLNLAVHRLLTANRVLKAWLIVELLDDLSVDNSESLGFGRYVRKNNARLLLEFLEFGMKPWQRELMGWPQRWVDKTRR